MKKKPPAVIWVIVADNGALVAVCRTRREAIRSQYLGSRSVIQKYGRRS